MLNFARKCEYYENVYFMMEKDQKIALGKPRLSNQFNQDAPKTVFKVLVADPDAYSTKDGLFFKFTNENTYAHLVEKHEMLKISGNDDHSFVVLQNGQTAYFNCGVEDLYEEMTKPIEGNVVDLTGKSSFKLYMGQSLAPRDIQKICPLKRSDIEQTSFSLRISKSGKSYEDYTGACYNTEMVYSRSSGSADFPYLINLSGSSYYCAIQPSEIKDMMRAIQVLGTTEIDLYERTKAAFQSYRENKKEISIQEASLEKERKPNRPRRTGGVRVSII